MAVVLLLVHVVKRKIHLSQRRKKLDATEKVTEKAVSVLSSIQENTGKQKTNVTEEAEDEDLTFARHISNELKKSRCKVKGPSEDKNSAINFLGAISMSCKFNDLVTTDQKCSL